MQATRNMDKQYKGRCENREYGHRVAAEMTRDTEVKKDSTISSSAKPDRRETTPRTRTIKQLNKN